jgi:acetoin utilization deacetylase AcuC-like enzyme
VSLHLWTSARYTFPLPPDHRFPIAKYEGLRRRIVENRGAFSTTLHEPGLAARNDLLRVHTTEYVDAVTDGTLSDSALRRLGFPWSPALVERSYRSVSGTIEAADAALTNGVAMNLAGGTHHAFADHGEGFCVFNDVAVAIRSLQHAGRVGRAAIVDLDVHQGNGTNAIFAADDSVYTFSMHGRRNYPFAKVPGSLDVELEDGTGDEEYLATLETVLPNVIADSRADVVFYLAGADAHEHDRLGRLRMTRAGLARRDVIVLQAAREVGIPVAIVIAGGYGRDIEETISIHAETARIAAEFAASSSAINIGRR